MLSSEGTEAVSYTHLDKKATISAEDLEELKSVFHLFMYEILGLKEEASSRYALIYNQYQGINHSIILIKRCTS